MGFAIAHNLSAINANNLNTKAVVAQKKATEKLSSGYKINRAGDNASGLAVSEKLRSQTRGLKQATANSNDAISLIQTAEGGLNETHAVLQRIRELAVQSANGTYQDDTDREAMDLEVQALKKEVDRISKSTEFNKIKLLDGSLGGSSNIAGEYGANYGFRNGDVADALGAYSVSSNVSGAQIDFTTGASGVGGENATFETGDTGAKVTVNLVEGKFYTNDEINDLIKNAFTEKGMTAANATIKFNADAGGITASDGVSAGPTEAGLRDTGTTSDAVTKLGTGANGALGYGDEIKFTANTYGVAKDVGAGRAETITLSTDVDAGKEWVEVKAGVANASGDTLTIHLATGKEYTEDDIHNLLAKAGYDIEVDIQDTTDPTTSATKIAFTKSDSTGDVTLAGGAGLGKEQASGGAGTGLIFQIGANGTSDQRVSLEVKDMSSAGLGISSLSVSTRENADKAIKSADEAVKQVSLQRAGLGALQNRLEYTVNNLTTTNENLTAAESAIRDTDMAEMVIENTKQSILQSASQAMLAQANQAPQSVLQLLG